MWKKLLTPTLIITLAILFGLTWYCSIQAEKHFRLWVDRTNEVAPALVTTELDDYRRQFFTAEATTTTRFGHQSVELHHLIRHYVWGVTIITTAAAETTEQIPAVSELRIITDIGPTGAARGRLTLPQLSTTTVPALTVERIAGEWHIDADVDTGSWHFSFDRGSLDLSDNLTLRFNNWQHSAQMRELRHLPLGVQQTAIDEFILTSGTEKVFSLEGLNFKGGTHRETDGSYRSDTDISFKNLSGTAESFEQGQLALELAQIDEKLVDSFVLTRKTLRRHLQQGELNRDVLATEFLFPLVDQFLSSGLTLKLSSLNLATEGGTLQATGEAALPADSAHQLALELRELIHGHLDVEFDARILNRLARFTGQQNRDRNEAVQEEELRMILLGLSQLDFLTRRENGRFQLLLSYEEGKIRLNNQPFRLF